jgi:FkbM family methyltransferase
MYLIQGLRIRVVSFWRQAEQLGFWGALQLRLVYKYNQVGKRLGLPSFWPLIRLRLPQYDVVIYLRTGTSDYAVLTQVFLEREYEPLDNLDSVRTIIDCGANVGYSSVYFLKRYPHANVLAVEPDPENAIICQQNLAPYGSRVEVIASAVWSHPAKLALVRGVYRDGGAWATQVRAVGPEKECANAHLLSTDMPSLIRSCGRETVDILKIDIERSEAVVFQSGTDEWIPLVKNIAIELHDEECARVFAAAMKPYDFDLLRSGELTICREIRARAVSMKSTSRA